MLHNGMQVSAQKLVPCSRVFHLSALQHSAWHLVNSCIGDEERKGREHQANVR